MTTIVIIRHQRVKIVPLHNIKVYVGVQAQLCTLLTVVLDGGE